jgi:alpha-tubulin suppressor-like RCC1 family protein
MRDLERKEVSYESDNTNKEWSTLSHNFVLFNGGVVISMQDISITKINTPEKVNQLSCGMGHIICKTILKRVYTWGKNESGQLGIGDNY